MMITLTEAKAGETFMVLHDLRNEKAQKLPIQADTKIEILKRSNVGYLTGIRINQETFALTKEETDLIYGVKLDPK